ncbi:PAS domain-containing protein [Paralysiella testudinis]|uniref:PAS domain-containing protein n=1 Tax=Paralysiella testudinis TaxID=2809020 RepID=UPI001E5C7478|nr:PAS domain-containing protein [Paralysiella testudinis]
MVEKTLHYFNDSTARTVYVTDIEFPYPDGELIVSRTDTNGIITHANQVFVDISGWQREEIIGAPHCILRHPDMPKAAYADLWATIQRGERWMGYVKNLRKDGGFYWVYATVLPNIRQGKVIGYSSIRRKPCRNQVAEAEALYAAMRAQEGSHV